MKQISIFASTLVVCSFTIFQALAQEAVPPPMPAYQSLANQQLDQLLGPIALYPDPLIAQILPAATLPTQIVLADRYVTGGGDSNLIDQQPWDASVQAIARYPSILKYLDDNLAWTTELGQAFLNQQQDVMDSVQRLRASAQNVGNLQSTPQQQVVMDSGDIEILPADPEVIYVPVYQPENVYYQNGFGLSFGIGWPIGVWLNCDFDWHHRNLVFWGRDHPRPANWWHERPDQRDVLIGRNTSVWRPENHRATSTFNRGDRGWNNPGVRPIAPTVNRPEQHAAQSHETPPREIPPRNVAPVIAPRPEPAPVERPAPVQHFAPAPAPVQRSQPAITRPASSSAFIGIQSAQQTRTFSTRGQQSMQPATRSAPAPQPRSAPPMNNGGGGGGGGNHGSDQQKH